MRVDLPVCLGPNSSKLFLEAAEQALNPRVITRLFYAVF